MGPGGLRHNRPCYPPEIHPVPIIWGTGWDLGPENLASKGIRSPDRPAGSESLYRLLCPGPYVICTLLLHSAIHNIRIYDTQPSSSSLVLTTRAAVPMGKILNLSYPPITDSEKTIWWAAEGTGTPVLRRIRQSVRMEHLGSRWTDFREIRYW